MQPHRVRLKGPWQYQWIRAISTEKALEFQGEVNFQTEGTTPMPISWQELFGRECGTVKFQRRFQCPTNLEAHERVSIVLDGIGGKGIVILNNQPLGTIETSNQMQCFDITNYLQPSNLLEVEITCEANFNFNNPAGLYDVVAIEIMGEDLMAEDE